MPVSSMNEVSWNDSQGMLTNSREMAGIRQNQGPGSRSQDDAMVGYFFQRPQSDTELMGGYTNKRWAVGDDSVIEQVISNSRNICFHSLRGFLHALDLFLCYSRGFSCCQCSVYVYYCVMDMHASVYNILLTIAGERDAGSRFRKRLPWIDTLSRGKWQPFWILGFHTKQTKACKPQQLRTKGVKNMQPCIIK